MKAKLLVLFIITIFSSNVFAEYYLVYPAAPVSCEQCYKPKHKKNNVVYKKKRHKSIVYKKRTFHKPCAGVVKCSPCGEYVKSTCGQPDYIVYSAQSTDCLTYEGVLAGEEQ